MCDVRTKLNKTWGCKHLSIRGFLVLLWPRIMVHVGSIVRWYLMHLLHSDIPVTKEIRWILFRLIEFFIVSSPIGLQRVKLKCIIILLWLATSSLCGCNRLCNIDFADVTGPWIGWFPLRCWIGRYLVSIRWPRVQSDTTITFLLNSRHWRRIKRNPGRILCWRRSKRHSSIWHIRYTSLWDALPGIIRWANWRPSIWIGDLLFVSSGVTGEKRITQWLLEWRWCHRTEI